MIPLTVGSLFSGIGGFELGLERTGGFKTAWQCEINPFCLKVLEKHWPNVKRFTDIKKMGVEEEIPHVDVICGGFPCQDISCAGKGAGIHAERSGLWWEMLRIVRLVRPRYVLVENVAALLNKGLDEVLGSLAESGYDAEWTCLRASEFGLMHNRERLYLVAYDARRNENTRRLLETGIFRGSSKQPRGVRCHENGNFSGDGTIHDESPLVRSVHGLSKESHGSRLKALGNAIVPQCSQFVGQCILDSIRTEATQ